MKKRGGTFICCTVFWDERFWVAVFEKIADNKLTAAKVTFGAEPKDSDVYEYILLQYKNLVFSPSVEYTFCNKKVSPKRALRNARNIQKQAGVGTKSQQALQLAKQQYKTEKQIKTKQEKIQTENRLYELKMQKKKEKHKGH